MSLNSSVGVASLKLHLGSLIKVQQLQIWGTGRVEGCGVTYLRDLGFYLRSST